MAIELQMEKMRCAEATSIRDSAVQRLASAYDSIKEKAAAINRLQAEKADLEARLAKVEVRIKETAEQARAEERQVMEGELARLRDVIRNLKDSVEAEKQTRIGPEFSPLTSTSISDSSSPTDDTASTITAVDSNGFGENVWQNLFYPSLKILMHAAKGSACSGKRDRSSIYRPAFEPSFPSSSIPV